MPQSLSDVPMADLVLETREWNGGAGMSVADWIGCVGGFEHAIGYGELFWPDFVELDGCVFFAGVSEAGYRGFLDQTGGDKRAVEAVLNHRHVLDLFADARPTREQVVYLGRLLREVWAAKLARDFPGRRFVVAFAEQGCEALLDYEVTFYQDDAEAIVRDHECSDESTFLVGWTCPGTNFVSEMLSCPTQLSAIKPAKSSTNCPTTLRGKT